VRKVAAGGVLVALVVMSTSLAAQARVRERYDMGDSEGRLMAYYSSGVAFSPLGMFTVPRPGGLIAAVEVSYLPPLSASQRVAGNDKPEATNLAPAFPRPRAYVGLPGAFGLEVSWIPPVRTFDVAANLVSAAVTRSLGTVGSIEIIPRLSVLGGQVKGAITCDRETLSGSAAYRVYYRAVCHNRQSDDFFEPRHLSLEAVGVLRRAGLQPYVMLGARTEKTEFDIGVINTDGSRDTDQPILELRTTRAYGSAGVSWMPNASRLRGAIEAYYAPGSVFTARILAGVRIR
jgi:hypothetical protein